MIASTDARDGTTPTYSLTHADLCRAVQSMMEIDRHGCEDELSATICAVASHIVARDPWDAMPIGQRIAGEDLARRLSGLLDVPRDRAEAAVLDVLGMSRQRAILLALLSYAAELTGTPPAPIADRIATTEPRRPAVRIVSDDREAAA